MPLTKAGIPRASVKKALTNGSVIEIFTHDDYGLSLDPKLWAKGDCKTCLGRGFIWKHPHETSSNPDFRHAETDVLKRAHPILAKRFAKPAPQLDNLMGEVFPCTTCAVPRYEETRRMVEERLQKAKERGESIEHELEKIHHELGHDISFKENSLEEKSP